MVLSFPLDPRIRQETGTLDRMFCLVSRQDDSNTINLLKVTFFHVGTERVSIIREDIPPCWKVWNTNMTTQISRDKCEVM